MVDLNGFDASRVPPMNPNDLLPIGNYRAVITQSIVRQIKAGTGSNLELTLRIIEGSYANRTLRAWLNLWHQREDVRIIAQAELSTICRAINVITPKSSVDLHDRPLIIEVSRKVRQDTGAVVNNIIAYSPIPPTATAVVGNVMPPRNS